MAAFERENADYLVICGDYLNHGPRNPIPEGYDPQQLARLLNTRKTKILAVRGNCDSEVDQMLLEFPCMGDSLIFFTGTRRCFVTHGHIFSEDKLPPLSAGDIFISGHTHIQVLKEEKGLVFLNPGSPSIPKGNSFAGYAIIENDRVCLKRIDGTEISGLNLTR